MRNLISLFLFLVLFSANVFAASGSGNVSSVGSFGGFNLSSSQINFPLSGITGSATVSSQGLFTITCGRFDASLVANNFYPCYRDGVAYQVTTGSSFHQLQASYVANTGVLIPFQTVSASATIAFPSVSLTGGIYESGATTIYTRTTSATASLWASDSAVQTYGSARFVGIQWSSATQGIVKITGFETTP